MGWEVGERLKVQGTYVYLWLIMLMYGRNQHKTVIILQLNKLKKKKPCLKIIKKFGSLKHELGALQTLVRVEFSVSPGT